MLHRILCPVDFSEPSRRALRYALAISRWHESELTVLHVEDLLRYAASAEGGGYPDIAERHHQQLQDFIRHAGGKDRGVRVYIAPGDPVSRILERAAHEPSDLIVMGTNGRSGLSRLVLGSVTERVLRQSTVPVLTIPRGAEFHESGVLTPFDPILRPSDTTLNLQKTALARLRRRRQASEISERLRF
jgi:nucleotide-binding universal stress UspA family protein